MREPKPGEIWRCEENAVGEVLVVHEYYFRGYWGSTRMDSYYIRFPSDPTNTPWAVDKAEWKYFTLVKEAPIGNAPVRNDPWSKGPEGETLGPSGLKWL